MDWKVHDEDRPQPSSVVPGDLVSFGPPSDAISLFDGKELLHWEHLDGRPAEWTIQDGEFVVAPETGDIQTKDGFGDCQLFVQWAAPLPVVGKGQGRGNSGIFLMGLYEIQVLDSYENPTYADGSAGAVYGQYPPLVNASLQPGDWQFFHIIFHRPRFNDDGSLQKPAILTVFHNNVLIQDHAELTGPTAHNEQPPYSVHPEKLPLRLQDHGDKVRFRRIWIRALA